MADELDLGELMRKAQELQAKLREMQESAASKIVTADAGGGMVRATVDGAMNVHKIEIDPALLAGNDREMLQDLVVVAVNEALKRAQKLVSDEMTKLGPLGGIKFPGT